MSVVAKSPTLSETDAVLGLGRDVPITELAQSFAEASRVLNAAVFAGRTGVLRMGDVALESAIIEDASRSEALVARYVAPILKKDKSADTVLETVTLWIESGGNYQEVADSLGLHANAVRYRVRAYQDRIGQELSSFESRCQAWWALRWHRAQRD